MSISPLSAIVAALVFMTSFGHAKEIELWFTPMSTEGPPKAPLLQWTKEHFPKLLPGITVEENYGPPIYQDAQQKFDMWVRMSPRWLSTSPMFDIKT